jgi:single-strand DNA-binding protein
MLPNITIEGRAVADPELRFTGNGKAVASLRVAASESKKDANGNWENGDKIFVNASIWEEAGEQVAEHIRKGDKVLVTGRLYQREYETTAGEKRTSLEVKFATVAKIVDAKKAARTTATTSAPSNTVDPWATAPTSQDEPPF